MGIEREDLFGEMAIDIALRANLDVRVAVWLEMNDGQSFPSPFGKEGEIYSILRSIRVLDEVLE